MDENGIEGELYESKVDLDQDPVRLKPYKLGYVLEYVLEQEIEKYVKGGRWIRGTPAWTSPVFLHLVPKRRDLPDELRKEKLKHLSTEARSLDDWAGLIREHYSVRLVHDFRAVNKRTPLDVYPMPDVRDFRKFCQGKNYFSTLDLKACFYQIPLGPQASQVYGITTPFGTYIPKFLGFGPKSAPAASSRMLDRLLEGLSHVCAGRIDDIIVATETLDEHIQVLGEL